ncbi:putative glycosyl hydrolase family 38 [Operophtera brumata]|uniref:Putative glycosyl hydrolase family 38 n=1 Tax=Operophtera brumata TaxID=104452 RepID=A0A0L7LUJ0_OPEBR|nr:putative glycosyl hydrolase family 38 [Operophtera brumata]
MPHVGAQLPPRDSQLVDIPTEVVDIPTRQSAATHELVFIAHLKPLMYKSFYVRQITRTKRDVNLIQPHKRTQEIYENINDYWKEVRDRTYVDIRNMDDGQGKDQGADIDTIDLDVLKDDNVSINDNVQDLEKIIREGREKVDVVRKRQPANAYPSLNEEEMRMLSDDPMVVERLDDFFVMENEDIKLHIDNTSGEIKHVAFPGAGANLSISFHYYPGCVGNNEVAANRSSGAYILRPNATRPVPLQPGQFHSVRGKVVSELRMSWSDNVLSVARLYSGFKFTVMTDRSQGGSSLIEGEIELMLHRRLLHDDAFGVGEALNETAKGKGLVARGTHRVLLSTSDGYHSDVKKNIIQMHLRPLIFVSDAGDMTLEDWLKLKNCFSWLKQALPEGLNLLTVEPWGDKLLLRLENYLSKSNNSTIEVDLANILTNINIKSVKETMLSAYEDKSRQQWKWKTEKDFSESFNHEYGSFNEVRKAVDVGEERDDGYKVKIGAKGIRTFIVNYELIK